MPEDQNMELDIHQPDDNYGAETTEEEAEDDVPADDYEDDDDAEIYEEEAYDPGLVYAEDSNLIQMMDTAADTGVRINFRGILLMDNLDRRDNIKKQAIQHLEQLLASNQVSAVHCLTWLVAMPSCLDVVRTEQEEDLVTGNMLIVTLLAWTVLLISSALLLVTSFFQAPRIVGFVAGGCLGLACIAFSVPMFAPARSEFAGHLTPPILSPTGLRVALNMQQWLMLLADGREEVQDLLC